MYIAGTCIYLLIFRFCTPALLHSGVKGLRIYIRALLGARLDARALKLKTKYQSLAGSADPSFDTLLESEVCMYGMYVHWYATCTYVHVHVRQPGLMITGRTQDKIRSKTDKRLTQNHHAISSQMLRKCIFHLCTRIRID